MKHCNAAGGMGGNALCGNTNETVVLSDKDVDCSACLKLMVEHALLKDWHMSPNMVEYQKKNNVSKPLQFVSIAQAVKVLKPYRTIDKLRALVDEGWVLDNYKHKELAHFIGASREKTTQSVGKLRKEQVSR